MWYYISRDKQLGPVDEKGLKELWRDGIINERTYVWKDGMPKWIHLAKTELANTILTPLSGLPAPKDKTEQRIPPVPGYSPSNPRLLRPASVRIKELKAKFTAFWILYIVGFAILVIGVLLTIPAAYSYSTGSLTYALRAILILLGISALIVSVVFEFTLLHRYWEVIQDGFARTTPGNAVGGLFIPFFNFYWAFVSIWGLSKDMNAYIERHSIQWNKLNKGLALAYPILILSGVVVSFIPGDFFTLIRFLGAFASFIILVILLNQWKNAAINFITFQEQSKT